MFYYADDGASVEREDRNMKEKRYYQAKSDSCFKKGVILSLLTPGPIGVAFMFAAAAYGCADVYYNPEIYSDLMEKTFKKGVRIEKGS